MSKYIILTSNMKHQGHSAPLPAPGRGGFRAPREMELAGDGAASSIHAASMQQQWNAVDSSSLAATTATLPHSPLLDS